jgi:hypothetical protein
MSKNDGGKALMVAAMLICIVVAVCAVVYAFNLKFGEKVGSISTVATVPTATTNAVISEHASSPSSARSMMSAVVPVNPAVEAAYAKIVSSASSGDPATIASATATYTKDISNASKPETNVEPLPDSVVAHIVLNGSQRDDAKIQSMLEYQAKIGTPVTNFEQVSSTDRQNAFQNYIYSKITNEFGWNSQQIDSYARQIKESRDPGTLDNIGYYVDAAGKYSIPLLAPCTTILANAAGEAAASATASGDKDSQIAAEYSAAESASPYLSCEIAFLAWLDNSPLVKRNLDPSILTRTVDADIEWKENYSNTGKP